MFAHSKKGKKLNLSVMHIPTIELFFSALKPNKKYKILFQLSNMKNESVNIVRDLNLY